MISRVSSDGVCWLRVGYREPRYDSREALWGKKKVAPFELETRIYIHGYQHRGKKCPGQVTPLCIIITTFSASTTLVYLGVRYFFFPPLLLKGCLSVSEASYGRSERLRCAIDVWSFSGCHLLPTRPNERGVERSLFSQWLFPNTFAPHGHTWTRRHLIHALRLTAAINMSAKPN